MGKVRQMARTVLSYLPRLGLIPIPEANRPNGLSVMVTVKDEEDWVTITDRKSTRLNSSHGYISYAVFCLKKKKKEKNHRDRQQKKSKSRLANRVTRHHLES